MASACGDVESGATAQPANDSDSELTLFGTPDEATAPAGPGYASASFERDGERWVPRSWGDCRIEVSAPGWGNARFVVDPDIEPDPASSTLAVLAWENGCASGQPPDDRDVQPVVLATDGHSVEIVVLVEPFSGDAACPGNPSFELEVDLGEPLAGRAVLDASVDPPAARPWPPTQSSIDSGGRE